MKCPHDGGGGVKHHHGGEAASAHVSIGTIDVAGANALVPAALKDKIAFEQRTLEKSLGDHKATYTFAMPKGWTQESPSWAKLKADDKGGFFSEMQIQADCDGECKPKAWEAIADKNFFAARAKGTVVKDQKQPGSRLMIADVDNNGVKTTDVVFAWWKDGEPSYHACVATLDESIKDAAPAFEKACTAVAIDGAE